MGRLIAVFTDVLKLNDTIVRSGVFEKIEMEV